MALIRRTIEYGWFPGDAFYADKPTPPYYSLAHIVLAGLSAATGYAPHELWAMLPPLVVVVTSATTCAWLWVFTGDPRVAVIGAAVEMLVSAPHEPAWSVMLYPRGLALAPPALALMYFVRALREGRVPYAVAAGIALGVSLATHLVIGVCGAVAMLLMMMTVSECFPIRGPVTCCRISWAALSLRCLPCTDPRSSITTGAGVWLSKPIGGEWRWRR